jgi:hypothetical protein
MTKRVKNRNLNMFLRNNGKKDLVHVLYPLLYVAKKEKNIKLCFDGPAK